MTSPDGKAEGTYAFPLTFAQLRLWFLEQLEPGTTAYLIPWFIHVRGNLNVEALQPSLNGLVARHEVLRTTFRASQGEPVQVVVPTLDIPLPLVDISGAPDPYREAQRHWSEEKEIPLDLRNGPLLRATLLRLGEQEHVLLLTTHHMVFDGWSRGILVRDLSALYQASLSGQSAQLPDLPIQYADYAVWQRAHSQGEKLDQKLAYWKGRLEGAPSRLDLPTDRPRPAMQTFRGAEKRVTLPKNLTEKLNGLGRREGVTLFMTLLATFQVLLARYSFQEDIVVGTPVANRNRAEIEGLIGFFANTLVLRTNLAGNPSFRELLGRVKETALSAYAHEDIPFEKLVDELRPERSLSHNPIFQVLFSVRHEPVREFEFSGLKFEFIENTGEISKFDLSFLLAEEADGIRGRVEYNTDLFDAATIQRMMQHWQILLEGVAANPDQLIAELPLLAEAERNQIVVEWNKTKKDFPSDRSLHEFIEKQVEQTPDAPALLFESQQLSYRELNARANQLAHWLRKRGVGPDVLVGICVDRSVEMVVGLLGIMKAGGAYVPIDPDLPRERMTGMLQDAEPRVLLTQEYWLELFHEQSLPILCLDRDWCTLQVEPETNPVLVTQGTNLAYAIYTSGSTGKPKGVPNVHRGIVNRLLWMQDTYRLVENDRVLQKTPYSFDVSLWEFFWPLMTGACLVVARATGHKDPDYLVNLIIEQNITTIHFVPSMLSIFLETPEIEHCTSLRHVFCSGEALPFELQERFFQRLGAELHNLYGPTEASVDVTYWRCTPNSGRSSVPIGRPIWNTQIYILDKHLQPVPAGIAGELHIGGVGLARAHLLRAELTRQQFIPDSFSH